MPENLTGRTNEHRGIPLRCPGCAKAMSPLELPAASAEVDVCEHCGGIWLDWFDGEVRALATETLRISSPDLKAAAEGEEEERKSNEALAIGACPRDRQHLVAERYVMSAASVVPGRPSGAELLRCESCMGAFVSRASAEVLAFVAPTDEPPPSQAAATRARPLPWERFIAVVRAWLAPRG